jgi:hypothetical protein
VRGGSRGRPIRSATECRAEARGAPWCRRSCGGSTRCACGGSTVTKRAVCSSPCTRKPASHRHPWDARHSRGTSGSPPRKRASRRARRPPSSHCKSG